MSGHLPIEKELVVSLLKKGRLIKKEHEIFSSGSLVRLVRLSLGMTQRQLAKRARVPQSTISRIEKEETHPNETTLRKIFNALECDITSLPIPRFTSIEDLLALRARKLAESNLQYLEGTMALELQQPDKKWREYLLKKEIESLLENPSRLWEEDAD